MEVAEIATDYLSNMAGYPISGWGWMHWRGGAQIEKAWKPKLQYLNDQPLMELIASCKKLKSKEQRLAYDIWVQIMAKS